MRSPKITVQKIPRRLIIKTSKIKKKRKITSGGHVSCLCSFRPGDSLLHPLLHTYAQQCSNRVLFANIIDQSWMDHNYSCKSCSQSLPPHVLPFERGDPAHLSISSASRLLHPSCLCKASSSEVSGVSPL